jgi:N-acetylglucosaminyldiphosphoundecaprenol N-acetyl-beta-D-mannosaminyltransferase
MPGLNAPAPRRFILGQPFDLLDADAAIQRILALVEARQPGYVTFVNPHSLVRSRRDPEFRSALSRSTLTLCDGVGIGLACRLLGLPHASRVPGPELMPRLCDQGRERGLRHFFYGGGPGIAEALASRFTQRLPGLAVCGTHCPPFRELSAEEDAAIVTAINRCRPDVVWVGLGTAKQEKWMAAHAGRIAAPVMLGVGAAFDFHAGVVTRAPECVRHAGLEWAWRLAHEPRRLWRRNLDSPLFLALVACQALRNLASGVTSEV